jgi:hypothetical protein
MFLCVDHGVSTSAQAVHVHHHVHVGVHILSAGTPKDSSTPAPGSTTPAPKNSSTADGAGGAATAGGDGSLGDGAFVSNPDSRALFEVELLLDDHSGEGIC